MRLFTLTLTSPYKLYYSLSEAIVQRFPTVNYGEVEKKMASFLAIAGDRDGGRSRRSKSTGTATPTPTGIADRDDAVTE